MTTTQNIQKYYDSFNIRDLPAFINLLHDDVIHDINQGKIEVGKAAFTEFMQQAFDVAKERISDLIIMSTTDGKHAAAKFMVDGTYLKTIPNYPEARGQSYRLAVGSFFEMEDEKIKRITVYYNMNDWVDQVR